MTGNNGSHATVEAPVAEIHLPSTIVLPEWFFNDVCDEQTLLTMADDILTTAQARILHGKEAALYGEQAKRLQASAYVQSIFAMIAMSDKRRKFIMWALVQLQETGLWRYADQEWDSIEEAIGDIAQREIEKNADGSAASNWRFIATQLVPAARALGVPAIKVIAMLDNNSKMRTAVPLMRWALERENPERQLEELERILQDVVNPQISQMEYRKRVSAWSSNPNAFLGKTVSLLPTNKSFYLMDPKGGGLAVIEVANTAELRAIETATRGLFAESEFMPRDATALMKVLAATGKPLIPTARPLVPEEFEKLEAQDIHQITGTVRVSLENLILHSMEELQAQFVSQIAGDRPARCLYYTLVEAKGNTLFIQVTLEI